MGVPVLPIWITGTYRVLPVGARWPRRHPLALYVGKPFTITAALIELWRKEKLDPYDAAARLVRERVLELAKEASPEEYAS